jgi:hypothetical protein
MYVSRTIELIWRRKGHVANNCQIRNTNKILFGNPENIKTLADRIIKIRQR